jgi:hypothetical protein
MRQTRDWKLRGLTVLPYLEVGNPVVVFPLVEHIVVVSTLLFAKALCSPVYEQEFVTNVAKLQQFIKQQE